MQTARYHISVNKILILILFLSAFLNIYGLFPNFYLHQKEPNVTSFSDKLLLQITHDFNFDPVFELNPEEAKKDMYTPSYGFSLYYLHTFFRVSALIFIFAIHHIIGFDFGVPGAFVGITAKDFISPQVLELLRDNLLQVSRFLTALIAVGIVYLTFEIAQALFKDKTISLLSALSLTLMPLFVREAHYATPDIPQTFLFALSFLLSLKIWQKPVLKSYILAGFVAGIATSVKYLPLSLLPLLFFHLLNSKTALINKKLIFALISAVFGYLAVMPFAPFHIEELVKNYRYNMSYYAPEQLVDVSFFSKIWPTYLHVAHFKFLWSYGILAIPLLVALWGIITGLKKNRSAALSVLLFILAYTAFITLYVATIYSYLPLPLLPFLAIFVGLGGWSILKKLKSFKFLPQLVSPLAFLIIFLPSLWANFEADKACSEEINEYQARKWVVENASPKMKLAYQPGILVDVALGNVAWSGLSVPFSLSELQNLGISYSALASGYTEGYSDWALDSFFPSPYILQNQYIALVTGEYQNLATKVKEFKKPTMCQDNTIVIYKLPQPLSEATTTLEKFNFDNLAEFKLWKFSKLGWDDETQVVFNQPGDHDKSGMLYYHYQQSTLNKVRRQFAFAYATPVFSPEIKATPGQKYTATAWVKVDELADKMIPDGFLRLDFYGSEKGKSLLTVLSPRVTKTSGERLAVIAIAPKSTQSAKIGFQALAANSFGGYLVDEVEILTGN